MVKEKSAFAQLVASLQQGRLSVRHPSWGRILVHVEYGKVEVAMVGDCVSAVSPRFARGVWEETLLFNREGIWRCITTNTVLAESEIFVQLLYNETPKPLADCGGYAIRVVVTVPHQKRPEMVAMLGPQFRDWRALQTGTLRTVAVLTT